MLTLHLATLVSILVFWLTDTDLTETQILFLLKTYVSLYTENGWKHHFFFSYLVMEVNRCIHFTFQKVLFPH